MTTPTISEAARRAAEAVHAAYQNLGVEYATEEGVARIIQSALDSAHPAPKEGATPETDALIDSLYNSKLNMAEILARVEGHACQLELRLSEAKRKQERADKEANDFQSRLFDVLRERDALRSHLKAANELLGRAWSVLHKTNRDTLANEIATHLNQQSK